MDLIIGQQNNQVSELYKLLNMDIDLDLEEESQNNSNNSICGKCMITDSDLQDNAITLKCGHKFNYVPLYNEIKYQKTNKYSLAYDYTKLAINQIKCPYCRTITDNILPYFTLYRDDNVEIIKGVTTPAKYSLHINDCQHRLKTSGKLCQQSGCHTPYGILCNRHYNNIINRNMKDKKHDKKHDNMDPYLMNVDGRSEIYKMKVVELKNILRKNRCRLGGTRNVLINRILTESLSNEHWIN